MDTNDPQNSIEWLWKKNSIVGFREYGKSAGMTIKKISNLPEGFAVLMAESLTLDFRFLKKMYDEWISGKNRFDERGECLFAAFDGSKLIGIGGLNKDPYLVDEGIGRVRHLYVLRSYRRKGLGKSLMGEITKSAKMNFSKLRLRTETEGGAHFYESIGFQRVRDSSASHEIVFEETK